MLSRYLLRRETSRVIAGRLLKVIHLLVNKDQTCGVLGRYIGENVAILHDVVHYATTTGDPVGILSLDQEKAFDRADWGFMRSALSAMGFGPSFISWVDLFYHRVQSSVNVNGLYILVSEVLAMNIRCNPRVSGLSLPGSLPLYPISQYADDTSLILSSDDSIKACFGTYALFKAASGAKLNHSKSKGLWLGEWSGRTDPPIVFDWSSTKLKILGVFVGHGNLE